MSSRRRRPALSGTRFRKGAAEAARGGNGQTMYPPVRPPSWFGDLPPLVRLVIVLLILAPVGWIVWKRTVKDAEERFAINWLRGATLGQSCGLYAIDHRGQFPKTLEEMVPRHLKNEKALRHESRGNPEFVYFPGLTTKSPADLPLIAAPRRDKGGRIVVYVNRLEVQVNERTYRGLKKYYEKWMEEQGKAQ